METYRQEKTALATFLVTLMKTYDVIAPIKQDVVRFQHITKEQVNNIHYEQNAYFPLKQFFFPQRQTLFRFNKNNITTPPLNTPKRVFFGIRKCDLNAIKHQDMVFLQQVSDPYYDAARKNSLLLGYHCTTAPSPYCFCGTLNLLDFFDLMYYDYGDYFVVEVGSEKGRKLVKNYKKLFVSSRQLTHEERKIREASRLLKDDISQYYDHPDWKKGVNNCLSCGACTALCPTCYCFDIHDEVKMADPNKGERIREWSSCQLVNFTEVAGGRIFRKDREQRFKHRIYHQLDYFKKRNGITLCVGCGRCISGCPTRIDFVHLLNEMK